ncbi:MAG: 2-oxoacid:ferredoxin oxidoreductase subunit beta [Planctomycetes bacterium]|nr:2-oxoacid:ferredoxin oxidoreductase subunit beta [Planctomycetota bacterium]MCC7399139.1 2-oxoacid:ferredoxin oxidoreductase subunit beta [Planctomycetota bacterium]
MTTSEHPPLAKKDYKSDQEVRWCPGCGDYSILNAVQGAFAKLQKQLHQTVIISGIGCSSRFPYYMETFGFHTIHGRAPAIATGVKVANPELDVWVVTGDGDAMSIGGNHFIHAMRRNVGLRILMFNNRIYGLTKGQFSPTSEQGKVTKSSPLGSVDYPFAPIALALGAGGTFVARGIDILGAHLEETIVRASGHQGTAYVEIYQNCNIFNDGAYKATTDKEVRDQRILYLQHGQPLLFGANKDRGIAFDSHFQPCLVSGGDLGKAFVWDETSESPAPAMALATMSEAEFPVPVGVFRRREKPTFEAGVVQQMAAAKARKQESLHDLLHAGEVWDVS